MGDAAVAEVLVALDLEVLVRQPPVASQLLLVGEILAIADVEVAPGVEVDLRPAPGHRRHGVDDADKGSNAGEISFDYKAGARVATRVAVSFPDTPLRHGLSPVDGADPALLNQPSMPPDLVRLSCGVEAAEDLVAQGDYDDLDSPFAGITDEDIDSLFT